MSNAQIVEQIRKYVSHLASQKVGEATTDYCSGDEDFYEYDCGNFDDAVHLGVRIGCDMERLEVIEVLRGILDND